MRAARRGEDGGRGVGCRQQVREHGRPPLPAGGALGTEQKRVRPGRQGHSAPRPVLLIPANGTEFGGAGPSLLCSVPRDTAIATCPTSLRLIRHNLGGP